MSGTAIADAGGLGTIEIKAMQDHGYTTEFAVGITAASATLGPIIPPSLPMVIYGMQANVSIGKLFAGGFLPGAVMAILMMLMVGYFAQCATRAPTSSSRGAGWAGRSLELAASVIAFALAALVGTSALGADPSRFGSPLVARDGRRQDVQVRGVHGAPDAGDPDRRHGDRPVHADRGARSPPSPGRCSSGFVWYRTLSWRMLVKVSMETIETTATVLFIVAAASIFALGADATQVTDAIAQWVLSIFDALAVGVPAARQHLPAVRRLLHGDDRGDHRSSFRCSCRSSPSSASIPIHFGLIMVLNLMIGLLTPPVGMVLFVLQKVAKMSFERTVKAVLPWLWPLLATPGAHHLRAAARAVAAAACIYK